MRLKKWDDLPEKMQNDAVKKYYDSLSKKKGSLFLKRIFDMVGSILLLILLSPVFLILAVIIKLDSRGPIFFRQVRVTQYRRTFRIFKFRTMVNDADKIGSQVTTQNDSRVTKVGHFLRKYRLDEIPQLLNILIGDMSFVGTRPEVEKYVQAYTDEMMATLLLLAGVTSEASIEYKDEEKILTNINDVDKIYIEKVLPEKMTYNLKYMKNYRILKDFIIIVKTLITVIQ